MAIYLTAFITIIFIDYIDWIQTQHMRSIVTLKNAVAWNNRLPNGVCCSHNTYDFTTMCSKLCSWEISVIFSFESQIKFHARNFSYSSYIIINTQRTADTYSFQPRSRVGISFTASSQRGNIIVFNSNIDADPLNQPINTRYTVKNEVAAFDYELSSTCVNSYGGNCYKPCKSTAQTCYSNGTFTCNFPYYGPDCDNIVTYCDDDDCLNGGSCQIPTTSSTSICTCPLGYAGQFCELIDYNFNDVCGNGGSVQVSSGVSYCSCKVGYFGKTCKATCDSYCLNNGSCSILLTRPTCTCPNGFYGDRCQFKTCYYQCLNGGRCDTSNGKCICPVSWSGVSCTTRTCSPSSCLGSCSGSMCVCNIANTFGTLCQLNTPVPNQCQNGNATITISSGAAQFNCPCPSDKYGKRCEYLVASNSYCNGNGIAVRSTTSNKGFECRCNSGFSGTECNLRVSITSCVHGQINNLECICELGWSGPSCNLKLCDKLSCINGICQNGNCICNFGFSGADCLFQSCNNLCQHGICDVTSNKCLCSEEFNGQYCEQRICTNRSCLNGGRCLIYKDSRYCFCNSGYSGERCEIDLNICSPNPCTNGGTCSRSLNGYECDCKFGYTGKNCEIIEEGCNAFRFVCQNGGVCVQQIGNSKYVCECEADYSGSFCQYENLCRNFKCTNGDCVQNAHQVECVCFPGYGGTNCEIQLDAYSYIKIDGGRLYAIIAIIAFFFISALFYAYKQLKNKSHIIISSSTKNNTANIVDKDKKSLKVYNKSRKSRSKKYSNYDNVKNYDYDNLTSNVSENIPSTYDTINGTQNQAGYVYDSLNQNNQQYINYTYDNFISKEQDQNQSNYANNNSNRKSNSHSEKITENDTNKLFKQPTEEFIDETYVDGERVRSHLTMKYNFQEENNE